MRSCIRYEERACPRRPALDAALAQLGDSDLVEIGPVVELTTRGGERAGIVRARVRVDRAIVQRTIAVVHRADSMSMIDATCVDPERFADAHDEVARMVCAA